MKGNKHYQVRVTETCVNWGVVEVDAPSQREAERMAEERFDSGEHEDGTVEVDTLVLTQDGHWVGWSEEDSRADPDNPYHVVADPRADGPSRDSACEKAGTEFASLAELLAQLKRGVAAPLPPGEPWGEMIGRISTAGVIAEVDEETYDHFLNVLPPRWLGRGGYAFGEGYDRLRLFWSRAPGQFFCRQLDDQEHRTFCRLAGIGLSSG
jgi:hypothetical protein